MRIVWLLFFALLTLLVGLRLWRGGGDGPAAVETAPAAPPARPVAALLVAAPDAPAALEAATPPPALADSLVRFALTLRGTPYQWAGNRPETGFDCSGFLNYVYGRFGISTPHSTALLIDAGQPVPRAAARPGDLVVFTGTAPDSRTPGHAGIVISALGEVPLRFVHASSARREPGVKVSQVENTDYERRFMQVRRVLPAGAEASSRPSAPVVAARPAPRPAPAPTPPAPVAALPRRPVALPEVPATPPATRPVLRRAGRPAARKSVAAAPRRKRTTAARPVRARPGAKAATAKAGARSRRVAARPARPAAPAQKRAKRR